MQSGRKVSLRSKSKGNYSRNSNEISKNHQSQQYHDSHEPSQFLQLNNNKRKVAPIQRNYNAKNEQSQKNNHSSNNNLKSAKISSKNRKQIQSIHEEMDDYQHNNQDNHKYQHNYNKYDDQEVHHSKELKKNNSKKNIQSMDSYKKDGQVVQQQEKMKGLNQNMQKLSESILDLKQEYKRLEKEQKKFNQVKEIVKFNHQTSPKIHLKSIFSAENPNQSRQILKQRQMQYRQYLKDKNSQKQNRRKVLQEIAKRDQLKNEQYLRQKERRKEQDKLQRIKEIRELQQYDEKHKKQKEDQQYGKKLAKEVVKKFGHKQSIIKRKEIQDEQKRLKKKLKDEEMLSQRKQIYKPHNIKFIEEHQKWYSEKSQELMGDKKKSRELYVNLVSQRNQFLQDFYKGNFHNIVNEQIQNRKQKKKEPFIKVKKMKEYQQYVKQKFVPRSSLLQNSSTSAQGKQKQGMERNNSSQSHKNIKMVKRYRYYKGVAYGEKIDKQRISKSPQQIYQIGEQNFEYMKKLPKNRSTSHQLPKEINKTKQGISNSGEKAGRVTQYMVNLRKPKTTTVNLQESFKLDELKMVMNNIKSKDSMLNLRQKAIDYLPEGKSENYDKELSAINKGIVQNIERKLSLLGQL